MQEDAYLFNLLVVGHSIDRQVFDKKSFFGVHPNFEIYPFMRVEKIPDLSKHLEGKGIHLELVKIK